MIGRQVSFVVTNSGHWKAFQEPVKPNNRTVMIGALLIGKTTWIKKRKWSAPSIRAASHNSFGIWAKNCRNRKILKALAINGTVNDQYLFSQVPPGIGKMLPRINK